MLQLSHTANQTRSPQTDAAEAEAALRHAAYKFAACLPEAVAEMGRLREAGADPAEAELAFAPVLRALDAVNEAADGCLASLRETRSPLDRLRQLSGG